MKFEVRWDEVNDMYELGIDVGKPGWWTLGLTGDEAEFWTDSDAVLSARKTLIGYSLRRDQPGLMAHVREQFRALPTPVILATCAFSLTKGRPA